MFVLRLPVVDIRAVGPGIWNDWKGVLLRNLYHATAAFFWRVKAELETRPLKPPPPANNSASAYPANMAERITPIIDDLGQAYWLGFSMENLVRHARFFDLALESGEDVSVQTRVDKPRDVTELWVLTRDRVGLFADLTMRFQLRARKS